MKKLFYAVVIVVVGAALLFAVAYAAPPAEARPYCHANSGASGYVYLNNPAWVQHLENNGTPKAGHELDFFTVTGDTDCNGAADPTAEPTALPTDVPTDVPTDEPTSVPTDVPTGVPTAIPTDTPTDEPTDEPTVTPTDEPTEVFEPTPTPTGVEPTPKATTVECVREVCGFLWHLVGPDGQQADFASFSPRPGGGWYLPNARAQQACLGWVAVNAPYGRPIGRAEAARLIRCQGGSCAK